MAIYYHDIQRVKERVSSIQLSIKEMDQALESGSTVLDDMNQIRTEFLDNKKLLSSKKVSGAQLMNQLGEIKNLAEKMDIKFNDVEIDPRNTFPLISKRNGKEEIKIGDKVYKTLRFNFSSSDPSLSKDKKLNTDIWYEEGTYLWIDWSR